MRPRSSWFRPLLGVLSVGFFMACMESPTASEPGVSFAKGGKPGGGGGGNAPPASFDLPASSGSVDGLFSDGDTFTGTFDADQMSLIVDCPRTFGLERPDQWSVVAGDEVHCSGKDGFSRLDLNDLGSCSDLTNGCQVGTNGHVPDDGYGPDLNYYFRVKTGSGKASFAAYNIVWTDGLATVIGTTPDGAPCRWHLMGTTAEFWDEGLDSNQGPHAGPSPMNLDVVVERQDLECL